MLVPARMEVARSVVNCILYGSEGMRTGGSGNVDNCKLFFREETASHIYSLVKFDAGAQRARRLTNVSHSLRLQDYSDLTCPDVCSNQETKSASIPFLC